MKTSESVSNIMPALIKAQAEFPTMPKDCQGYGYKYCSLDTIVSAIKPIMAKHGLGFIQGVEDTLNAEDEVVDCIITRIMHTSGEWIETACPMPKLEMAKTNAVQNMGGAITYMRRYTLSSILGITADEDVDAADFKPEVKKEIKKEEPKKEVKKTAYTKAQATEIGEIMKATYEDGSNIFDDSDKTLFRDLLMKNGENALESAKATLRERVGKWKK